MKTPLNARVETLTILIDTREKNIDHIKKFFDENNVKYEFKKLDVGDYSFKFEGVDYSNKVVIERKNSLEEFSINLSKERERFIRELERGKHIKKILLIENGSLDDIIKHKYKSQLTHQSYLASILSLQEQYSLDVLFISKELSPKLIYGKLYYYIRNKLKECEMYV